jgi:uncharacterized cupin superfamily protein
MTAYTRKRIDELAAIHHGAVKLAGDELGVQAFGLQVLELPPGFDGYPEHDHAQDGQEEVYVVLAGSAELTVAGAPVAAEVGTLVRVDATARRRVVPGPDGVRILAIGRAPRGADERPDAFFAGARA